jgi:hypothetical protein
VTDDLKRNVQTAALTLVWLVTLSPASAQAPGALDARQPIPYFIAEGEQANYYRESDRELALWALNAWEQSAGGTIRLEAAQETKALIRVYWAPPMGGQYGQMQPLLVDGRRGAAIFIRPDMTALGPVIERLTAEDPLLRDVIIYLTCLHELGHGFGLPHTNSYEDIMYSFQYGGNLTQYFGRYRNRLDTRIDIADETGLSPADVNQLRELYPMNM